jgi:multidrug efflux pump subunit AcrA (membrane-fusion protein)
VIRLLVILAVLAAAGWGVWAVAPSLKPKAQAAEAPAVPNTAVKRGDVEFSIMAKGDLQGGNTQMLTVPMTGGQPVAITFLRLNGELVEKGDEVVKFDTTEQEYRLREAEADLAEAEQQIVQAKAEAEAKEEESRYELLKAQGDVKLAEADVRRNEVLPRLVAKQNDMALEAARDKLAKIEKDLGNRLETARSGIAIQEAAKSKAAMKAETARKNIASMTLRANSAGYVALQQNDEGMIRWGMYLPPYQLGDIARPGKGVAQIPDLASWEATARIGELDRGHIAEGQPATISVVALHGRTLQGKIKTIGGTTGPPWDRHFDCRVAIDNPPPDLRPGMTAQLRIVTGHMKNATWIPSQALFEAEGRKYVFLRTPGGYKPRDVEMVRRSESQVVVNGLNEGQSIALANPEQAAKKSQAGGGAMQAISAK